MIYQEVATQGLGEPEVILRKGDLRVKMKIRTGSQPYQAHTERAPKAKVSVQVGVVRNVGDYQRPHSEGERD